MSLNENGIGGFKEVTFMITGQGAYSRLKSESGVHRVQRVPETESGGRIHTSTVTVAVLPEAEEIDFHLDLNECKFDVFRASGNGGQCVNTTDSAVRLTHIPTGIVISCQDEKSQLKNKDKALKILRSRLYEMELAKRHDAEAEERKSQIGTDLQFPPGSCDGPSDQADPASDRRGFKRRSGSGHRSSDRSRSGSQTGKNERTVRKEQQRVR